MRKHKFLDELNLSDEMRPDKWCLDDKRMEDWKKQRKKYGFDSRELWSMDLSFYLWLYERLKFYKEVACVNMDYHKFKFKGKIYTQGQLVDMMIEGCEEYFHSRNKDFTKKLSKKARNVPKIWAIVLPVMWY